MKDCIKYERLFEKALYNELTTTEENIFNEHLNSCSGCSEKFLELKDTISIIKKYQRPEPDNNFMDNFWENLEPKLGIKENRFNNFFLNIVDLFRYDSKFKYQFATGLALLIVGFVLGKFVLNGNGINTREVYSDKYNTEINQSAVNVEAARYLERSKILLLGIVNFDPSKDDAETINLPHIQTISKQLVNQAPSLTSELNEPSQQQLKKLVNALQLIMLQIANLEENNSIDGIELVKEGVNSQDIFLKINIQQLQESDRNFNGQKINTGKENKNI